MLELIRHCHCGESCPVKFRLCKCITCDQVEVSQAHEHPDNMEKNQVYEREILRGGIQDQDLLVSQKPTALLNRLTSK